MGCQRVLAAGVLAPESITLQHHWHLGPAPVSVARGRRLVVDAAGPLPPDTVEILRLLTSEMVTNGIQHARTALTLGVTLTEAHVLVTVADLSSVLPVVKPIDFQRQSGRGLSLISQLADDYGAINDDDGKTSWFTISRTPDGT